MKIQNSEIYWGFNFEPILTFQMLKACLKFELFSEVFQKNSEVYKFRSFPNIPKI